MPKKTMVNLTRLEKLMKAKHWGISELAKYSKVKYDTVYSIVKGRRQNTTLEILTSLATALGTTPDYLLEEGDGAPAPASRLPTAIQQLADIAGNLSEVRQEELIRIATALQKLEQEQQTLTTPMVATLMELHDKLVEQGVSADTLHLLEALLPPPRRLSHARTRQGPHEPGEQYGGM
jgi:transcriptional regulator with XRE-family HTH domain